MQQTFLLMLFYIYMTFLSDPKVSFQSKSVSVEFKDLTGILLNSLVLHLFIMSYVLLCIFLKVFCCDQDWVCCEFMKIIWYLKCNAGVL